MIMYSNGSKLDPNRMEKDHKGQKITLMALKDVINEIPSYSVATSPTKILINVGLNDLDNSTMDEIITNYEKMFKILHEMMPTSKIYVSSIFHRKDNKFQSEISQINNELDLLCEELNHDVKNLSNFTLHKMIDNLKYAMFNIFPKPAAPSHSSYRKTKNRFSR